MAPKRHVVRGPFRIEETSQKITYRTMTLPYHDNWFWSKRHRSQEVMLSDTFRKGTF